MDTGPATNGEVSFPRVKVNPTGWEGVGEARDEIDKAGKMTRQANMSLLITVRARTAQGRDANFYANNW